MKSRTSFFNAPLAGDMLRRFWPLWLGFGLCLLALLPVFLVTQRVNYGAITLDSLVGTTLSGTVAVIALLSGLAAMAQFHFLYFRRSCELLCALPLRRETVFGTACLTGLLALVLLEALTALLTLPLTLLSTLHVSTVALWFGVAALSTVFFYGLAVFCALLTGNLLVLPALYAVLNLVAVVVANCVKTLLMRLLYGYLDTGALMRLAEWFSPLIKITRQLDSSYGDPAALTTCALYAAVGVGLMLLALRLYKRRAMECAGDAVAIPVLKPVFLVCMSVGTALVLPWVLIDLLFSSLTRGRPAFWLNLGLMLLGAVLGFFAARMLLEKSLRVFQSGWRTLAILCASIALVVTLLELDVTGYEKRVPNAADVEQVCINGYVTLRDPENIAAAVDFQRLLTEHKADFDTPLSPDLDEPVWGRTISLQFVGKQGVMQREYRFFGPEGSITDPESVLGRFAALMNEPEAIESWAPAKLPVSRETIASAYLTVQQGEHTLQYPLGDEAVTFYNEAILPDIHDGRIGRFTYRGENNSNIELGLTLAVRAEDYPELEGELQSLRMMSGPTWSEPTMALYETKWYSIPMDAERSVRWLTENTPFVPEANEYGLAWMTPATVGGIG